MKVKRGIIKKQNITISKSKKQEQNTWCIPLHPIMPGMYNTGDRAKLKEFERKMLKELNR